MSKTVGTSVAHRFIFLALAYASIIGVAFLTWGAGLGIAFAVQGLALYLANEAFEDDRQFHLVATIILVIVTGTFVNGVVLMDIF